MYLHVGQEVVVRQQDIIGVFDIENTTVSKHTRQFLAAAEKNGCVEYVNYDLPKSFTVCASPRREKHNTRDTVIVSPIAARTLKKRAKQSNL